MTFPGIHRRAFSDIFVPLNTTLILLRFVYVIFASVLMAAYFKFVCECHRGDLLVHLDFFDVSDILSMRVHSQYFAALERRLARIVWNWDRVTSLTAQTSHALRHWILSTFLMNFAAAVVATVNLSTHLKQFPQHFEMYLPALMNVIVSFYVLFVGATVAHSNGMVANRMYLLLAATHFQNVSQREEEEHGADDFEERDREGELMMAVRQQNVFAQAQTVSVTSQAKRIGIAVYGLELHRNLFLAFLAPFIAFCAFCLNEWLPKGDV